jgi:hypothetical protein
MIMDLILYPRFSLENEFKYLGFFFKPDNYKVVDWEFLVKRIESGILIWVNHLLSKGGRLVLLKSMLEIILVYWSSIEIMIPKGILSRTSKVSFQYLSSWKQNIVGIPLALWLSLATLNYLGR